MNERLRERTAKPIHVPSRFWPIPVLVSFGPDDFSANTDLDLDNNRDVVRRPKSQRSSHAGNPSS